MQLHQTPGANTQRLRCVNVQHVQRFCHQGPNVSYHLLQRVRCSSRSHSLVLLCIRTRTPHTGVRRCFEGGTVNPLTLKPYVRKSESSNSCLQYVLGAQVRAVLPDLLSQRGVPDLRPGLRAGRRRHMSQCAFPSISYCAWSLEHSVYAHPCRCAWRGALIVHRHRGVPPH